MPVSSRRPRECRIASVLILDPDPEIRALFARIVGRLGYQPLLDYGDPEEPDVVLVEPGDPGLLAGARALKTRRPELPVICASIHPAIAGAHPIESVTYLLKPFRAAALAQALAGAGILPGEDDESLLRPIRELAHRP